MLYSFDDGVDHAPSHAVRIGIFSENELILNDLVLSGARHL